MYLQQDTGTPEHKHGYTCGRYRNCKRTGEICTGHYICKSVVKEIVLADLQCVMSFVKDCEKDFITAASEYNALTTKKT